MTVCSANQQIGTYRALCDTGSNVNVVTHKIAKHYLDRAKPMNSTICGISNESIKVQKRILLEIRPWFESNKIITYQCDFWILPKLSEWGPVLPSRDISCKDMNFKLSPILADPMFWKAEPVSMILGIEFWAKFINENISLLCDDMLCYETRFGSIVLGKTGISGETDLVKPVFTTIKADIEELIEFFQKFWEIEDLSLCM